MIIRNRIMRLVLVLAFFVGDIRDDANRNCCDDGEDHEELF
jgi:hypothetical protein